MAGIADYIGVVFDTGSQVTKVGFAGEEAPRTILPTLVARPRHRALYDGLPEVQCGRDAHANRGLCNLTWPVKEGFVSDWDQMETLWHHIFYRELMVAPESSKVMQCVHPLIKSKDKELMAEIFFETFAVNGLYLGYSPTLVLYALGKTTGLVYENGYSCSYACPVFEGFPLITSTLMSPLTGEAMSNYMKMLLSNIGYSFTTPLEMELIDKIKAEVCYVARDYDAELAKHKASGEGSVLYQLPDGQHVIIGVERIQCPEMLFNPSINGMTCPNIVDLIEASINSCDLDHRHSFYQNVVIAGGSSMYQGLVERLQRELSLKVNKVLFNKTEVHEIPHRQASAWTGGSLLASLKCAEGFWMTKREYEDLGADCVNHKFF